MANFESTKNTDPVKEFLHTLTRTYSAHLVLTFLCQTGSLVSHGTTTGNCEYCPVINILPEA